MTIAQLAVGGFSDPLVRQFLHELQASGFEGEVDTSHATRTVLATDNSIYQRYPRAVVFPR
ncbi:MAG: FAD-binding oxidoreductase, partial [Paraburkholderia sp.]|nr:FAD-binding oxidoreductase [Paraburkholderia sp.]